VPTQVIRANCVLLGLSLAILSASPAHAYVEAAHSLGQVVNLSTNVLLMRVEKVDKEKNMVIYSKVRDIKGKHPTDVIKHNIGRGGFHPREWQYPMEWAEVGKLAVMFHNGGACETCMGTYWYQCYAGGEWWNMSHGEPFLLRTFAGNVDKLAAAVTEMLTGKEVVVPCMVDGNKDDLHLRRAKIERLRASLKLNDYNEKRDFVGWGGDDFRRLFGLPGFTHYSALTRVDPDAQAISAVDFLGDGKTHLCLVGSTKVVLLQNGGESLNELSLPGTLAGCRSAVWADYNGDGLPDLLLATPTGPRLYTNLGGGNFRDDTALLPKEACYNVTAVAWIDYDGDGRPDILLGNGFHGLRLYRNFYDPAKRIKELDDEDHAVRERATHELELVGPAILPQFKKALAQKPSLEVTKRIEGIMEKWKAPPKPSQPGQPQSPVPQPLWFEDVSEKVGLGPNGIGGKLKGDTLTVCDVDGDGRPDFLYGAGAGILVLNTPKGFVEAKDSGISYLTGKAGPVFGDFDNDGHPDLIVPQPNGLRLFHNDGKGHFTDVTAKAGDLAKFAGQATSAAWGDVDNDGHLDLVIGCLRGPNRYYRNKGDGTFEDASEALGLNQRIFNTQAVCLVDLNNDGALDMVFNNEGQESCVLLGNPELLAKHPTANFRIAGLDGVVGSKVTVRDQAGKVLASQFITGGDGRGGQSTPLARFALKPGIYQLEVRYSSGVRRTKEITMASTAVRGVIDEQVPKIE
jgi:hypothetical protein